MTDLMTTLQPTSPTATDSAAPAVAEPTLITEQQVMFSTAAAVAPQPVTTRRWTDVIGSFVAALRVGGGPAGTGAARITPSATPTCRTR